MFFNPPLFFCATNVPQAVCFCFFFTTATAQRLWLPVRFPGSLLCSDLPCSDGSNRTGPDRIGSELARQKTHPPSPARPRPRPKPKQKQKPKPRASTETTAQQQTMLATGLRFIFIFSSLPSLPTATAAQPSSSDHPTRTLAPSRSLRLIIIICWIFNIEAGRSGFSGNTHEYKT